MVMPLGNQHCLMRRENEWDVGILQGTLTVNASRGVILDAEVDVLRYAKTKAAGLGEVALDELVFFHFQAGLQNLHRFVPVAYSHVRGNLFVAADAKRAYGVASLREHWLLASELLKNFGCLGEAVAGFTDGDVQD